MRIGIDFDNTIVSYDELFHAVAVEQGVIPLDTPVNKIAVRDYLRRHEKEAVWTEMQGYVYGARMDDASAYSGVIDFMQVAKAAGHDLAIMSHKTRHPFLGPQYDLHAAARGWADMHLCIGGERLIAAERIFFELTKEEKLARVADFGCDVFIDDLPEILFAKMFPERTCRILFDAEDHHGDIGVDTCMRCCSWPEIQAALFS